MSLEDLLNGVDETIANSNSFIVDVFDSIDEGILGVMDPIITISTILAGIGCVIYLAQIILPMIESIEGIRIYPLLKPLLVAFIISHFTVLTGLLDAGLTNLSTTISTGYESQEASGYDFDEALNRNKQILKEEIAAARQERKYDDLKVVEQLFFPVLAVGEWFMQQIDILLLYLKYNVFFPILAWVANMIGNIAYLIVNLMSRFYRVFLCILGPLAFALSQFSYFQSSFGSWMARYISVGLWPTFANLLKYMSNQVLVQLGGAFGDSFEGMIALFLIIIMIAFLHFKIPEISEYVVTSGGVGGLNASMAKNIKRSAALATAAPAGIAAGAMLAANDGVLSSKLAQKVHDTLTKTGSFGRINRMGQKIGAATGKTVRSGTDYVVSKFKKETDEERYIRRENRVANKMERREKAMAPTKKEMRKRAKMLRSQQRHGFRLSPDQEEVLYRHKSGDYKGRGKFYATTPEQKARESQIAMRRFLLNGLDKGIRAQSRMGNPITPPSGWHPPFLFPQQ